MIKNYLLCFDKDGKFHGDFIVMRLLSSWCVVSLFLLVNGGFELFSLEKTAVFNLFNYGIVFVICFVFLSFLAFIGNKSNDEINSDLKLFPFFFIVYGVMSCLFSDADWKTAFVFCALGALMIFYYFNNGYFNFKNDLSKKTTVILICVFTVVFAVVCGLIGVLRYKTFTSANYDFGIFCNMFHNLREHFTLNTTCERDKFLSHFAVHISPVYYLLYPVYFLFPFAETLQISQALILASGVIPLCLIAKKYNLSNGFIACLSCMGMLSPVLICGCSYDLHENCFLFPFILWMFYFFEKDKIIPLIIFAILTMSVKEDAAIYVLIFALYMVINRRKFIKGGIVFGVGIIWFIASLLILKKFGEGVMTIRYENFLQSGETGLINVIKNCIENPAYLFSQMLDDEKGNIGAKVLLILQMFLPLAFIPFAVKKISNLILICPMLIINIFTVYCYQFDIGFQYCFAPFAFLIYLAIINLSEMKKETAEFTVMIASLCAVFLFVTGGLTDFVKYCSDYRNNSDLYSVMEQSFDVIGDNDSVIASTCLVPHLANRDIIYDLDDHTVKENEHTDWVVIDTRYGNGDENLEKYEGLDYRLYDTVENSNGNAVIYILKG